MTHTQLNDDLYATFDTAWYTETYFSTIDRLRLPTESAFDFYIRVGGRLGHDPNDQFSEILYRRLNHDVYKYLLSNKADFGYIHFLIFGREESHRKRPSSIKMELIRNICVELDPVFLNEHYDIDLELYVSPFDYYFLYAGERQISPSGLFCEESYRQLNPDVDAAIRSGKLSSGFAHFIDTLDRELRPYLTVAQWQQRLRQGRIDAKKNVLETNLPGVSHLYAFDVLNMIESYTNSINVKVAVANNPGLFAVVPNFLPEMIFGGYLAFFDFLQALKDAYNIDLRLIVFNSTSEDNHKWNIMRMKRSRIKVANIFSSIEYLTSDRTLQVCTGYKVISYCAETHYVADLIGKKLETTPIFFIQEYEPDFHENGDICTFSRNAFSLPHYGVYNSKVLLEYFINEANILQIHGDKYNYCYFENYFTKISVDKSEFMAKHGSKRTKRLVFYGRPEHHGTRNHFATFILGLREAIEKCYFDNQQWEFVSIGSLAYEGNYPLPLMNKMSILTTMAKDEYVELVKEADIGVSFISTPHPGIVHFQMANYGLVTVTNTTKFKTAEWLAATNNNIIGVELSPSRIAQGLKVAIDRSKDLDARYENARKATYLTEGDCLRTAIDAVGAAFGFVDGRRPGHQ